MRRAAGLVAVLAFAATPGSAQTPPPSRFFPQGGPTPPPRLFPGEAPPPQPTEPARMPRLTVTPAPAVAPTPFPPPAAVAPTPQTPQPDAQSDGPRGNAAVRLPRPEYLLRLDAGAVSVRRLNDGWQLVANGSVLHDFGPDQQAADEAVRAMRGLRATEWGAIGSPRPVVEYGLADGVAPRGTVNPRVSVPVDLKTVRAEPVRGAWVVRDDRTILLNFGPARADAEMAAAVAQRYGFNRLAQVGFPAPAMTYFYAAPEINGGGGGSDDPLAAIARVSQEQALARTGIDVPGVGFVGERLVIDPRAVEVRKDRGEWVLAHGPDVLARFGYSELTARDALRVVKDGRFTEFCRAGGADGLTFFLVNGQPPTRVPFAARGTHFDPDGLRPLEAAGQWGVFDAAGRRLFPAADKAEAETLTRLLKAYRFDTACQIGMSPKASLRFLAKTGR